jgi:hypothetical protein
MRRANLKEGQLLFLCFAKLPHALALTCRAFPQIVKFLNITKSYFLMITRDDVEDDISRSETTRGYCDDPLVHNSKSFFLQRAQIHVHSCAVNPESFKGAVVKLTVFLHRYLSLPHLLSARDRVFGCPSQGLGWEIRLVRNAPE